MRLGSIGASLLVHSLVLGVLLIPGTSAARRVMPLPVATPNVTMALIDLAKLQTKLHVPDRGTIQYPKKKKHPEPPKVAKRPEPPKPTKPVKVAAKPMPKPTPHPSVDPDHKLFDELRKNPQFAGMTDEQIRNMPLPAGMKDWKQVLAMTGKLDNLDWTQPPPDTGKKEASASLGGGFFGWAPPSIGQTAEYVGGPKRELVDGKWHFAFQYSGTIMVAEWPDNGFVAKVAYYPYGSKPEQGKTFEIPVVATDEDMSAHMIAQYTLISMGMPPEPVPTSAASR
ncbi:MAG TPA: hypothetical protein V6D05_04280 [Stenomitos sp.]